MLTRAYIIGALEQIETRIKSNHDDYKLDKYMLLGAYEARLEYVHASLNKLVRKLKEEKINDCN